MFELITTTLLLGSGFFIGRFLEAKHYRSIKKREERFLHKPAVTLVNVMTQRLSLRKVRLWWVPWSCRLTTLSVLASWRLFLGGEVRLLPYWIEVAVKRCA